jgi:hypothetical protein
MLNKAAVTGVTAVACSGPAIEPSLETEPTRTYVVASVERHSQSDQLRGEDFSVLLSVLKVPQFINGDRLLRLMGLRSDLPPVGTCEVIDFSNRASPSLSSLERVELLDVGDVDVLSGTHSTRLARQAFPTVTDFISGVVYTSRDKSADSVPPDAGLSLRAKGNAKLRGFALELAAPPRIEQVTLDATPLPLVVRLTASAPFELKWQKGTPGDLIWLEFGTNSGRKVVSCAFDDAQGQATVPAAMTDETGEARLTLHRLRRDSMHLTGFDQAEARMDSRLTHVFSLQ